MAVHTSHGRLIPVLSPAKTPSFIVPTQHTLCFIPRLIYSKSLSFTSKSTLLYAPRATMPPQKYVYPDPIPEFAEAEIQKFRTELWNKLLKDEETFGDDLDNVVEVCAEILGEFLHKEYGGPGTLLVEPFTDMLLALKERKLPGAPLAARASLLWAQNCVDQDWDVWNSTPSK